MITTAPFEIHSYMLEMPALYAVKCHECYLLSSPYHSAVYIKIMKLVPITE